VQRPVILNGIEEIGTRGDLMDRAIVVELPTLLYKARSGYAMPNPLVAITDGMWTPL
jgi:hypothetical protein